MKSSLQFPSIVALLFLIVSTVSAETETERFKAADSEGVTATRDSTTLYLQVDANVKGPITIPRLAAPLRSMQWQGSITDDGVSLKPEPDHWVVRWKNRPAEDATLVLQFDDEPLLLEEVKPIKKSADGSFYLPAHKAFTKGEKIRYEPQPFKNTVGYWTGKEDTAQWTIQIDKPGRFNLSVLQGCGKNQGGSRALIGFDWHKADHIVKKSILFEVNETGHFQNFQWNNIGEIDFSRQGEIIVSVKPYKIKKAALMDIRAIHLIRLPDKKK